MISADVMLFWNATKFCILQNNLKETHKFCHLLTLKLFYTCLNLFQPLNTKDILQNAGNQSVGGSHLLVKFDVKHRHFQVQKLY